MCKLLRSLGKTVEIGANKVIISGSANNHVADYKLVSTMRGSFCVLGPLLAKLGQAKVSMPGGCVIGVRPIDLHMKGIMALGVNSGINSDAEIYGLCGGVSFLGSSMVTACLNDSFAVKLGKTLVWLLFELKK